MGNFITITRFLLQTINPLFQRQHKIFHGLVHKIGEKHMHSNAKCALVCFTRSSGKSGKMLLWNKWIQIQIRSRGCIILFLPSICCATEEHSTCVNNCWRFCFTCENFALMRNFAAFHSLKILWQSSAQKHIKNIQRLWSEGFIGPPWRIQNSFQKLTLSRT